MAKTSKKKTSPPISTEIETPDNKNNNNNNNNNGIVKPKRKRKTVPRDFPKQRSSIYRGVTRHRWTGRYEAHLWDKNCWNESQSKKGRQVYLGAYDDEETAAHAYDLAALKYWGPDPILNFPLSTYEEELKGMEGQTKEEYIGSLRRKSSGFSRGVSKYRGVARHHHNGRWEARIGRVFGNKYLYLGTYATQEEAATAYDMAAIEYRGLNAVTNFDLSRYIKWLRPLQNNPNNISEPVPTCDSDVSPAQNPNQEKSTRTDIQLPSLVGSTNASSALGLLLQSSKFKEMLEQTAACNSPSSPSESNAPRSCFPADIQTSFDFQDANSFSEEHGITFDDYDSFFLPMFQCELDA